MLMTQVSSSFICATDTVPENTLPIPVYISLQHPTDCVAVTQLWSHSRGNLSEIWRQADRMLPWPQKFFFLLSPQTKWSRELASTSCGAEKRTEPNRYSLTAPQLVVGVTSRLNLWDQGNHILSLRLVTARVRYVLSSFASANWRPDRHFYVFYCGDVVPNLSISFFLFACDGLGGYK